MKYYSRRGHGSTFAQHLQGMNFYYRTVETAFHKSEKFFRLHILYAVFEHSNTRLAKSLLEVFITQQQLNTCCVPELHLLYLN